MTKLSVLVFIIALQAVCAGAVIWDLLSSLIGLRSTPISWQTRELIEIGGALGLLIGHDCECRMNSPQKCRSKNPQFAC
jgi:hypothetical protein